MTAVIATSVSDKAIGYRGIEISPGAGKAGRGHIVNGTLNAIIAAPARQITMPASRIRSLRKSARVRPGRCEVRRAAPMHLDDEAHMRTAFELALKGYRDGGCPIG